jgi:hypothetical protein
MVNVRQRQTREQKVDQQRIAEIEKEYPGWQVDPLKTYEVSELLFADVMSYVLKKADEKDQEI